MAGLPDLPECPVLAAWGLSEGLMNRLCKANLLVLQYQSLGRPTLSDNVELLAPLINNVGALHCNICVAKGSKKIPHTEIPTSKIIQDCAQASMLLWSTSSDST